MKIKYAIPLLTVVAMVACFAIGLADTDISQNFDPQDVRTLLAVLDRYLSPSDSTVIVIAVPASKMPSYDPVVHYAGLDTKDPHRADVWVSASTKQLDRSLLSGAFALAAMDTGDAGPNWKLLYDRAAQADAQLPPTAPDPYANRHQLETDVNEFLK